MKLPFHFVAAMVCMPVVVFSGSPILPESSRFYTAIRSNDLATLRNLVKKQGVKQIDSLGNTPLFYAAADGTVESLKLLLSYGADPNATNKKGATPLMWSVGQLPKVKLLVASGANVNAHSKSGISPLELAANFDGSPEVVNLLLDHGANVNAVDDFKISALEAAAGANNPEIVNVLLTHGAKVNMVDINGISPLMALAGNVANPDRSAVIADVLLRHGAKVNQTAVDKAGGSVANGPLEIGKFTALHMAAQLCNGKTVQQLIDDGAEVNAPDIKGMNALVWAVGTDHPDLKVIELLLKAGSDRKIALDWARRYNNPAVLKLFGLAPTSVTKQNTSTPIVNRTDVRLALARSIAGSQKPASNFYRTGGCMSCHAQNLTGMAVAAAKQIGIKADYKLEAEEALLTASKRAFVADDLFQLQGPGAGINGVDYILEHMRAAKLPSSIGTDSLIYYLLSSQTRDGSWPIGEARPPINDGIISLTARTIRALRTYTIPARQAEIDRSISRATHWLASANPVTNEDRTTQILGLIAAGRKVPSDRIQDLTKRQRATGGWGQTDNLPADAYATGEAIWALREAGLKASDPVIKKAVDFLIRTQQKDGTWHVVSRSVPFQPYFQSGFPYGHDQWISQAGTSIAAIALSRVVH